jgi:hypothetical protein
MRATLWPDRDGNPVREFGCWTAALNEMAEWLKSCRVDTVAMQATGVYWIALYDVLEQHGIRVVLVNARHTKNVPGRKTDVQECQWLMKLHTYGLMRDSFRLQQDMEYVRTIWRVRDRHVKEAGRAVQHMQKALTKMNIQLANVISDISGDSGQAIVSAVVKGERDLYKLADLADYRVKASREEVARSLEGNWRSDVLFELQQAVDKLPFRAPANAGRRRQTFALSGESSGSNAGDPRAVKRLTCRDRSAEEKKGAEATGQRTADGYEGGTPTDLWRGSDLHRRHQCNDGIHGDLGNRHGQEPFSGRGPPHLVDGLAPSKDISGGKAVGPGKKKVKHRVAVVLRTAATSLLQSDTHLRARYRHLRRQLPTFKAAVKAMARYLAVLIYRLLTHGEAWVDRGAAQFERRRLERELASLHSKANAKGFTLVPIAEAC